MHATTCAADGRLGASALGFRMRGVARPRPWGFGSDGGRSVRHRRAPIDRLRPIRVPVPVIAAQATSRARRWRLLC
jgi:hypothetical protein